MFTLNKTELIFCPTPAFFVPNIRDLSLFIAGGGGKAEDLGLNKVKFSRSPL